MADVIGPTGTMPGPLRYSTVGGFSLSGETWYDAEILSYNKAGHKAISQLRPATGYVLHCLESRRRGMKNDTIEQIRRSI